MTRSARPSATGATRAGSAAGSCDQSASIWITDVRSGRQRDPEPVEVGAAEPLLGGAMPDADPGRRRRAHRRGAPVPSGEPSSTTSSTAPGSASRMAAEIARQVVRLVVGRQDHPGAGAGRDRRGCAGPARAAGPARPTGPRRAGSVRSSRRRECTSERYGGDPDRNHHACSTRPPESLAVIFTLPAPADPAATLKVAVKAPSRGASTVDLAPGPARLGPGHGGLRGQRLDRGEPDGQRGTRLHRRLRRTSPRTRRPRPGGSAPACRGPGRHRQACRVAALRRVRAVGELAVPRPAPRPGRLLPLRPDRCARARRSSRTGGGWSWRCG